MKLQEQQKFINEFYDILILEHTPIFTFFKNNERIKECDNIPLFLKLIHQLDYDKLTLMSY